MKLCKDCIYYDSLRSKLETKKLGKKVCFCSYLNKALEKQTVKKMAKCDLYSSSKPD